MATITARAGQAGTSITVKRPSWSKVYDGYPKTAGGVAVEDDLPADTVFTSVFGAGYNKATYSNACGTRVSLALLAGGMKNVGYRKDITIKVTSHTYYGRVIEPGAARLKEFLQKKWGDPEEVKAPVTFDKVDKKLQGRTGIYIMIPKKPSVFGASGHATLWTGARVIGDHDYISDNTHAVYFWELK